MSLTVLNPATEDVLAELEPAGVAETDAAVARAKGAFRTWRDVAPGDRTSLGDLSIEVVDAERFRVRWVIVQTQMPKTEPAEEEAETETIS